MLRHNSIITIADAFILNSKLSVLLFFHCMFFYIFFFMKCKVFILVNYPGSNPGLDCVCLFENTVSRKSVFPLDCFFLYSCSCLLVLVYSQNCPD